ncbi:hypothetical protein [Polynucleobacter sp. AP-Sving-400A-A2]|uniref:hypothetical protein n=1 Tax=Polynucleobacter sp. AP-Sving-400A-A2 TaxID=2081049 RepID=UPI001BFDD6BF|nr:hypothetical protein [Polynucleobacter sp. AP-Sving-400A-A2]QWE15352.1 hypothetical protein C2758_04285 [Polynucleobacter sp. AP-Sving-400A-A2]
MEALFLSKFRKQLRSFLALCFLLGSLLGTHWIGFAHGIAHSGIQHQNIELSCNDQAPALGHSFASCHLLDALTLASFVASTPNLLLGTNLFHEVQFVSNSSSLAQTQIGLYQSRAPPSFIL